MAAQSNPPASFGYTWGFADNSRSDGSQIVEISPNINYTVSDNVSKQNFHCTVFHNAIQISNNKNEKDFILHFNFIHIQNEHK